MTNNYFEPDPWKIIENGFVKSQNRFSESIFSLGNGHMGLRGNFEERYTGDSMKGTYLAGIYYPDKTKVGWWKNGYPEYFAKVLNSTDWLGIDIELSGITLDLNKTRTTNFKRVLDMKRGLLKRSFRAELQNGAEIKVETERFISMDTKEAAVISYRIEVIKNAEDIKITPFLNGNIRNEDSNYDEFFWDVLGEESIAGNAFINLKTKRTEFITSTGMSLEIFKNGKLYTEAFALIKKPGFIGHSISCKCSPGDIFIINKYISCTTSRDYKPSLVRSRCSKLLKKISLEGLEKLRNNHIEAWSKIWKSCDIVIDGSVTAQQGIRFNIFNMMQTYTGHDSRLNIGPKGFTGEKYGGSTYWDTEAYCIPFYLSTTHEEISKNLLLYRYKQLGKAIENAEKLGFKNGAALYPMVTMNGEECHNEWEITFEEIHRNGAILYAIYTYINKTMDREYLAVYGLEVLIAVSRFWSQRVTFSLDKNSYVILGVTGPNEYENNVNNNWYTNKIAVWCLNYTLESLEWVEINDPDKYKKIINKTNFESDEKRRFRDIIDKMYYPQKDGLFLQQDGFLDKELVNVNNIPPEERPINQKWSWDRILRSSCIKQADVLQGLYFFENEFTEAELLKNYQFYEPLTVHESSLSPCIHSILASRLNLRNKAYEMYLRTARLDLDNYNNDTDDGCHITSMAGTWMSIVHGFGGLRYKNGEIYLNPTIPDEWHHYSFKIIDKGTTLTINVTGEAIIIDTDTEKRDVNIYGKKYSVTKGKDFSIEIPVSGAPPT